MKELFPLNTFQQDAVLKRLNDLLENDKELDDKMPYDEDTDTYSIDGDLTIDGDLSATGDAVISGKISGNEIVEVMTGYELILENSTKWTPIYCGVVKTGNKITFVVFGSFTKLSNDPFTLCEFNVPSVVGSKLYPYTVGSESNYLDNKKISFINVANPRLAEDGIIDTQKITNSQVQMSIRNIDSLTANQTFYFRYEVTFLLSDNLIPQE